MVKVFYFNLYLILWLLFLTWLIYGFSFRQIKDHELKLELESFLESDLVYLSMNRRPLTFLKLRLDRSWDPNISLKVMTICSFLDVDIIFSILGDYLSWSVFILSYCRHILTCILLLKVCSPNLSVISRIYKLILSSLPGLNEAWVLLALTLEVAQQLLESVLVILPLSDLVTWYLWLYFEQCRPVHFLGH